jgi:hypothetical protein
LAEAAGATAEGATDALGTATSTAAGAAEAEAASTGTLAEPSGATAVAVSAPTGVASEFAQAVAKTIAKIKNTLFIFNFSFDPIKIGVCNYTTRYLNVLINRMLKKY